MDRKSKLDERAKNYAGATYKEGDEPTLITFRARKDYKNGALEERARVRERFRRNLEELSAAHRKLKKRIDDLEAVVDPHKDEA